MGLLPRSSLLSPTDTPLAAGLRLNQSFIPLLGETNSSGLECADGVEEDRTLALVSEEPVGRRREGVCPGWGSVPGPLGGCEVAREKGVGLPDLWTLGSAELSKSLAAVSSFFRAQAWEPLEAKGSVLYTGKKTSEMSLRK